MSHDISVIGCFNTIDLEFDNITVSNLSYSSAISNPFANVAFSNNLIVNNMMISNVTLHENTGFFDFTKSGVNVSITDITMNEFYFAD